MNVCRSIVRWPYKVHQHRRALTYYHEAGSAQWGHVILISKQLVVFASSAGAACSQSFRSYHSHLWYTFYSACNFRCDTTRYGNWCEHNQIYAGVNGSVEATKSRAGQSNLTACTPPQSQNNANKRRCHWVLFIYFYRISKETLASFLLIPVMRCSANELRCRFHFRKITQEMGGQFRLITTTRRYIGKWYIVLL